MKSPVHRRAVVQNAISAALIIVLLLIAAAIVFRQFNYEATDFGIDRPAAEPLSPKTTGTESNLPSLLPAGFKTITAVETFGPDNLYVKIDGKADIYLQSGLRKLSCLRFVSLEDENLWAELFVYDMPSTKNAFTVYSTQRRINATNLALSRFSYKAGNSIFFIADNSYVEIIAADESQKLFDAMVTVAKNFIKISHEPEDFLSELNLFPETGLVPHSFRLHLKNTFGFEGLNNTFTAEYTFDDERVTAFISIQQSPKDATDTARNYQKFLIDNGAAIIPVVNEILDGKVLDLYGSIEIVFAVGPFAAGVHEADNQRSAEKLAIILNDNLTEAANNDR